MPSTPQAAVDFNQGFTDAWRSFATFVPKFIAFLVILFIGWIIAKVLARAVVMVLGRVGFDRAVERGGLHRMLERSDYDAKGLVGKIVYYGVLLVALQLGFGVFGPNPISDMLRGVVSFLPKAIVAIVIVVITAAIARAVRDLVSAALGSVSYGRVLATIASVFILGLGVIAALNQMGVAVTVTMPVLITVLATIGGIMVVGVGGGMVRPMQERWDRWLGTMERETQTVRQQHADRHPIPPQPTDSATQPQMPGNR